MAIGPEGTVIAGLIGSTIGSICGGIYGLYKIRKYTRSEGSVLRTWTKSWVAVLW